MISDLEWVDSTDHEEPFRECDHKNFNLDNEFEPLVSADSNGSDFEDNLRTFSYLKCLIATVSNEICR